MSQARQILGTYYGADNVNIEEPDVLYWSTNKVDRSAGGWIRLEDDIVLQTHIQLLADSLKVSEVVEVLGEPKYVLVVLASDGANCAGFSLVFPQYETVAVLFPSNTFLDVDSSQSISELVLSTPNSASRPIPDTTLVEWYGYDDYCHADR